MNRELIFCIEVCRLPLRSLFTFYRVDNVSEFAGSAAYLGLGKGSCKMLHLTGLFTGPQEHAIVCRSENFKYPDLLHLKNTHHEPFNALIFGIV